MSENKVKGLAVSIDVEIEHNSRMSVGRLGGYNIERLTFPSDMGKIMVAFSSTVLNDYPILVLKGDPRELAGILRRIAESIEEM